MERAVFTDTTFVSRVCDGPPARLQEELEEKLHHLVAVEKRTPKWPTAQWIVDITP